MVRSETALPAEGTIEDIFRRLEVWAKVAPKGLSRVEFFSEFARLRVINLLRESLEKENIPFYEIQLPSEETPSHFIWNYLDQLKEIPSGVVSVTGFPNPLLAVHPVNDYLRALNFNRENIAPDSICQIWWLSTSLLDRLVHVAPDLDSWFVLRMHLTESVAPSHELQTLMQPLDRKPYIPLDEARKRASYLKERFTNAVQQKAPASDILAQLVLPAVTALHDAGADKEAKELGSWMLEQLSEEELKKQEDLDVYNNLCWLANIYKYMGNYKRAMILYMKGLEIAKKKYGHLHRDVATFLNNIAEINRIQCNYTQAEILIKQAIAIDEKVLGKDHPEFVTNINNLALLYDMQGKYEEAEILYQQVIMIWKKSLGENHPNFASALNNLASLYQSQEKYKEAELLFKQAIKIDERILGPESFNLASDIYNLAILFFSQGKIDEAKQYFEKAIRVFQKSLTDDHPDLITIYNNYAQFLRHTNPEAEAQEYEAKAQAIRERRGEVGKE